MQWRSSLRRRVALIATQTIFLAAGALVALGCSDDDPPYGDAECRFDPSYCRGALGGSCRADIDCFEGSCCKGKHCGGGMCTFACSVDNQCPPGMGCAHNVCMFACRSDLDCAVGQRCEHGHAVCEWP